jgi:hypothetical protein
MCERDTIFFLMIALRIVSLELSPRSTRGENDSGEEINRRHAGI